MAAFRILISAGGSGGHFFPALAIAEEFARCYPNSRIEFVGTKKGIEYRVLKHSGKFPLHCIPGCKFYRIKRSRQLLNAFKLVWALLKSLWIILRFNPQIVMGSGGFVSAPVMSAAILLRKKTVVQEQNVSPGMVNRMLSRYVDLCFLAHQPLNNPSIFKRYVVIGNPIRKEIDQLANEAHSLPLNPIHICLIGGSQGARILNQTLIGCLPKLECYKDRIRITHQTGESDYETVKKNYQHSGIPHTVIKFVENMRDLYLSASLMISRSGSIITEYLAAGKPAILVPIERSSGDHQKSNAAYLIQHEAAVMILESELTPDHLFDAIEGLIKQPERLTQMSGNARKLYQPQGAQRAAEILHDRFPASKNS